MSRRVASRLRQLLLQTEQARERYRDAVLATGTLIAGSFVTLGRKCGKPNCRCATGDKHYGKFLSRSEGGKTRLVYVRAGDEVEVAAKAASYRRAREARAELMKLAARTAEIIDELLDVLTEPYPTSEPRRTKRRGREDGASGATE